MLRGRYVAVVADAEPDQATADAAQLGAVGDLARASALIGLAQALNGPARCALVTLRGGGNRNGADGALTAQTGYPAAVDFSRGFPRYRPWDGSRLAGASDAVLVVGALDLAPAAVRALAGRARSAVIGPRASAVAGVAAAIDSGTAGIHCGGTAVRMDDVALPLRPSIAGLPDPAVLIRALRDRLFLLPLAAGRP